MVSSYPGLLLRPFYILFPDPSQWHRTLSLLPDLTALFRRPHHSRIRFAGKSFLKFRHIGKRTVYAILTGRMGIRLHHQSLLLDADRISPKLSPGNEELLVRSKSIDTLRRWFS